jgi:hypothetical protein
MIELSYCPELNIYRIRSIVSGKETTRTHEQMIETGIKTEILDFCKKNENQEIEL